MNGAAASVTSLLTATHPPMSAEQMREQVNAIQRLMAAVMKEGEHYGRIPGGHKPSLWKPGAEKLCVAFHIEPSFIVEDLSTADHYRYRAKCIGTHQHTSIKLGEGMGSCSSMEQKFRWRRATDAEFDNTPRRRRRYKYRYDKDTLRPYEIKQVRAEHEDLENTILKMACKRAHVAMTLNVTAASDIFTQDIEDIPEHLRDEEGSEHTANAQPIQVQAPRRKSKSKKTKAAISKPAKEQSANQSVGIVIEEGKSDPAKLSLGQLRILRSRMDEAKLSDEALIQKFGSALGSMPADRFNEVAAWLREESRA